MARGGRRQGAPGQTYGNRTDLNTSRAPDPVPTAPAPVQPASQAADPGTAPDWVHPDQVTPMFAPTDRPNEPVTAGLPYGPGAGPAAPPRMDLAYMKRYLPLLHVAAQSPDTPQNVVAFVNYLSGQL
jgi:hypothetical protein